MAKIGGVGGCKLGLRLDHDLSSSLDCFGFALLRSRRERRLSVDNCDDPFNGKLISCDLTNSPTIN